MKLNKILYIPIFLITILGGCNHNLDDEITQLLEDIYYYQAVDDNLERLLEISDKYPNFHTGIISAEELLIKCYESRNDFELIYDLYPTAMEKYNSNLEYNSMKSLYGVSFFEVFSARIFLKNMEIEQFYLYSDRIENAQFYTFNDEFHESVISVRNIFLMDSIVNYIAYSCMMYNSGIYTEEEFSAAVIHELDLAYNLNQINELFSERFFLDLINFQTIDGKYPTDVLWELEPFLDFVDEMKELNCLNDNVFSRLELEVDRESNDDFLNYLIP